MIKKQRAAGKPSRDFPVEYEGEGSTLNAKKVTGLEWRQQVESCLDDFIDAMHLWFRRKDAAVEKSVMVKLHKIASYVGDDAEVNEINDMADKFLNEWKSRDAPYPAAGAILALPPGRQ